MSDILGKRVNIFKTFEYVLSDSSAMSSLNSDLIWCWLKLCLLSVVTWGFPRENSGKSACQCRTCRRHGFDLWVLKILWSRKWQPAPIFFVGKISWAEEMGRVQSIWNQRVWQDWKLNTWGHHKFYNQSSSYQLTLKVFMFSPNRVWYQILFRVTWNWMLACMIWFRHICIIPLWLFYDWSSALMKNFFNKGSPPAFFKG